MHVGPSGKMMILRVIVLVAFGAFLLQGMGRLSENEK